MSVNGVSGNNGDLEPNAELKYGEAQYNELYEQFTNLINDDRYKAYFNQGADLDKLQALLSEKLQALKEAIDNTYSEEVIDELMQALGALLKGSGSNMGLEARIEAYIALLDVKASIYPVDYQMLLAKLNSAENITRTVFDQLLSVAQSYKSGQIIETDRNALFEAVLQGITAIKLNQLLVLAKDRKEAIDDLNTYKAAFDDYNERLENLRGYSLTKEGPELSYLISDTKGHIPENENDKALIAKITGVMNKTEEQKSQSKAIGKSLAGLVLANEIQAKNVHKEVEGLLKEEQSLNNRAVFDENLKRLRDEGIWAEKSSNRRQEIQQQEALQAAKNAARIEAERRAKNENI